jgi:hypothetical protein
MSGPKVTEDAKRQILEAVGIGVHPPVACVAAGMGQSYYSDLRYRARHGDENAREFLEQINAAEARSEIAAVSATTRATEPVDDSPITCPTCGEEFSARPDQLAAMVARLTDVAKAKGMAGEVALKKLERRHPKRWSQKVIHTVQEEHDRLLDVAQRVLAPETFELLLEEYLSEGSGEGEAAGGQGRETSGDVH